MCNTSRDKIRYLTTVASEDAVGTTMINKRTLKECPTEHGDGRLLAVRYVGLHIRAYMLW